jgi:hypothetical protein
LTPRGFSKDYRLIFTKEMGNNSVSKNLKKIIQTVTEHIVYRRRRRRRRKRRRRIRRS